MVKVIKPNLLNNKIDINQNQYNYAGNIKTANMQNISQISDETFSIINSMNYKNDVTSTNLGTGSFQIKEFFSNIKDLVKNDIIPKVTNAVSEVGGKIHSFLEELGLIKSGSSGEKPETTTKPHSEPETTTKPHSETGITTEPETKPETTTEPSTAQDTKSSSIPNPNAGITQDIINRSDELVIGSRIDTTVRTDCKQYGLSQSINDNNKVSDGVLSAKEREMLVYLAYHETGDDPVQVTAVVSSFLNGWETSNVSFGRYLAYSCSQWSDHDDFYHNTDSYRAGTYTYNDVVNLDKYQLMVAENSYQIVSDCVDNVLSGTRNVNSTQWAGNHKNKYRTIVNMFHAPVD